MQLINDLSVKLKRYEKEISASINRVIQSGWLVLGPEVERFEASFADYQTSEYCVSVANGTDALELALRALSIKSDHLVATVANAGAYTTTALNCIGASAYFLDVDPISQCATFRSVEAALDFGVNAVVVTHLFGRVVPEIAEIAELCAKRGVPLLEDCAQAHGASLASKLAGSFGNIASFSFYPTKNLGALGDGGAITTNDKAYAQAVTQLRQYGWKDKYEIGMSGGRNSRLDAIQAALLSEFLPHLDEWNDERVSIALRYDAEITNPLVSKPPISRDQDGRPYVAHLYVVQTPSRDDLREYLKEQKIQSDVHYPIPDHKQETISDSVVDVSLPVTELLAQNILTLPCYPGMSQDQVQHVIESVNSWTP
jgi:aminotransferase EvaB